MVNRGGLLLAGVVLLAGTLYTPLLGASSPRLRLADHSTVRVEGKAPRGQSPAPGWSSRAALAERPLIDFNGDGRQDYITSSHLADLPSNLGGIIPNAGAVYVAYGKPNGTLGNGQRLTIVDAGLEPKQDDQFGRSITVGNIDLDGFTDVVVGVDGWDAKFGSSVSAGAIVVYRGSKEGLEFARFYENPKEREVLGHQTLLANVDGEPGDELIASAIGARVGNKQNAGKLYLFTPDFLRGQSDERPRSITRASLGFKPEANGFWGTSLFRGDFNHDGSFDVGIGMEASAGGAGLFNVAYGPDLREAQQVTLPNAQPGWRFGHAGLAFRLNDDEYPDALVTAPGEGGGAAYGLLSSEDGFTGAALRLQSPQSAPGDFDFWDVDHVGGPGHNTLISGSPGRDLTIGGQLLAEGGGVDLVQVRYLKAQDAYLTRWRSLDLERNTPTRPDIAWNQDTHAGFSVLARSIRPPTLYEVLYGMPGQTCDGENHAGAVGHVQFKFDPAKTRLAKIVRKPGGGICYEPPTFPEGEPNEGDEFPLTSPAF